MSWVRCGTEFYESLNLPSFLLWSQNICKADLKKVWFAMPVPTRPKQALPNKSYRLSENHFFLFFSKCYSQILFL